MTIDREPMEVIEPYINPALSLGIGLFLLCVGGRLLKSAVGLSFGLLGAGVGLKLSSSLSNRHLATFNRTHHWNSYSNSCSLPFQICDTPHFGNFIRYCLACHNVGMLLIWVTG